MANDVEHIVQGLNAWGAAPYETKALHRAVTNMSKTTLRSEREGDGEVNLLVTTVDGDWSIDGMGRVSAEEIVDTERLVVDAGDLLGLRNLLGQADLEAESILVEAEEIEDEEE